MGLRLLWGISRCGAYRVFFWGYKLALGVGGDRLGLGRTFFLTRIAWLHAPEKGFAFLGMQGNAVCERLKASPANPCTLFSV